MNGRPTKLEQLTIKRRNELIKHAYVLYPSGAEIARIFRLPRNTVSKVLKKEF